MPSKTSLSLRTINSKIYKNNFFFIKECYVCVYENLKMFHEKPWFCFTKNLQENGV